MIGYYVDGSGAAYEPSPVGRTPAYLSVLSKGERVFDIHPEIAHGALQTIARGQ